MKISGKILQIDKEQQVSNSFKKRNFVIEYTENPQYPEYIMFEIIQEKCGILNDFHIGQYVDVSFNLKGRKWVNADGETRYFNSLQAWRIEPSSGNTHDSTDNNDNDDFSDDDLPF